MPLSGAAAASLPLSLGRFGTLLCGRILLEEPEPSRENAEPAQLRKGCRSGPLSLRRSVRPQFTDTEAALLRSQVGFSQKGVPFGTSPFRTTASGSLCFCLPVPAVAADPSTSLATTVFWCVAGSWRTSHVCVERREDASK